MKGRRRITIPVFPATGNPVFLLLAGGLSLLTLFLVGFCAELARPTFWTNAFFTLGSGIGLVTCATTLPVFIRGSLPDRVLAVLVCAFPVSFWMASIVWTLLGAT